MKICSFQNCGRQHYSSGYCKSHYFQAYHGRELRDLITPDSRRKGSKSSNKYIIENDITRMELYDNAGNVKHEVIFNTKHLNDIKPYKWTASKDLYIHAYFYDENNIKRKMLLHKFIIYLTDQTIPDRYQVDHRDRNKLNCLDDNLRVCTPSQNNQNQKGRAGKTSKYKGVCLDNQSKKWKADITINYKHINLGTFPTEKEAAEAYNKSALKLFGEFALLNKIDDE